jgi:hypothetical protein
VYSAPDEKEKGNPSDYLFLCAVAGSQISKVQGANLSLDSFFPNPIRLSLSEGRHFIAGIPFKMNDTLKPPLPHRQADQRRT